MDVFHRPDKLDAMSTPRPAEREKRRPHPRRLPAEYQVGEAFRRLVRERALQTLVRGALPTPALKRLLKGALPRTAAAEMPDEIWAGLAAGIGAESPDFGMPLAQALHDRLAWDREPATDAEWERLAQEKPLEALWMAALSDAKPVRKAFPRYAAECLRAFRASPASLPPSWEFVEGLLEVQADSHRRHREAEKGLEDADRRFEAERERGEDLRDELKRLRRETSELRAEKAQAEKRAAAAAAAAAQAASRPLEPQRLEELERRLRKLEKENEHLRRELERALHDEGAGPAPVERADEAASDADAESRPSPAAELVALSEDPNPNRRVLRQILRKLFKKGKIGASHTHEDNVYRGVPDHDKGVAKEAMDLLYREGLLMPKPTATDPHVSLNPDEVPQVRAIIAGEISNPRLRRFVGL
jgi:hypothetical protein